LPVTSAPGGGTKFFTALGIAEVTYNSVNDLIRAEGVEVVDTSNFIAEYAKTMNALFDDSALTPSPTVALI
jgi:hypothetical protein